MGRKHNKTWKEKVKVPKDRNPFAKSTQEHKPEKGKGSYDRTKNKIIPREETVSREFFELTKYAVEIHLKNERFTEADDILEFVRGRINEYLPEYVIQLLGITFSFDKKLHNRQDLYQTLLDHVGQEKCLALMGDFNEEKK